MKQKKQRRQEHEIQDRIRVAVSEYEGEGFVLRLNSGTAWGGELVDTPEYGPVLINPQKISLCPAGTPDLLFVGGKGKVAWIEVKDLKGKAAEAQKRFIALATRLGHKVGIAKSPEDALKIVEDAMND